VKSYSEGDPFDLVVIDIQLPGISGYDVAKQIRGLDPPMCNLPLLAFSSSTIDRSGKFKKSGFDGFLPKPIQRRKLLKMVEFLLGNKETLKDQVLQDGMITQHSIIEKAKHSIRILLAEDNPINQKLADFMLTKAGYQVKIVENGKEAVEVYSADPDKFDLIFMDLQMPEMGGREATEILRQKGFKEIPIIAMTAESMMGDYEKCLEAGMNDYIAKPIKREIVFEKVRKWCLRDID
jgi:CheY-like chemotaxis protein